MSAAPIEWTLDTSDLVPGDVECWRGEPQNIGEAGEGWLFVIRRALDDGEHL